MVTFNHADLIASHRADAGRYRMQALAVATDAAQERSKRRALAMRRIAQELADRADWHDDHATGLSILCGEDA
jgi:hypothetical protein